MIKFSTPTRIILCLLLAGLAWIMAPNPLGTSESTAAPQQHLRAGLTLFVLTGALWITQALPLAVTALTVPLLAALSGLLSPRAALASFAHPIIFLFLGGFALAAALSRQGLDRALAHAVIRLARGRRLVAVILIAALAALLSMWMSNTATAAMMLPLALGLLHSDEKKGDVPSHIGPREQIFVLLALAYSASIGGIGTLVGSPPNAIAAAQAGIGFVEWLRIGLPTALILWPLMLFVLYLVLRPKLTGHIALATGSFLWTRERIITALIFAITVLGWVAGAPLARALGIEADMDTIVALAAIVLLAVTGVLGWRDLERQAQWGVLILFGGGLALSQVMSVSGASEFLAETVMNGIGSTHPFLLFIGVVAFVVFLTELVSNTASAALLLPIFLPVATAMGLPPATAAASIAVAASCAFMLPIATPPNAIVFGTERVPQTTMMLCGFWLNMTCILAIAVISSWVWP